MDQMSVNCISADHISIDSYILILVRCENFEALRTQHYEKIAYDHCISPNTYEVVALDTIDLGDSAEVKNPYNPTSPGQDLVSKHGEKRAKQLKRKEFLDRWTLEKLPKVFGVYMHCIAYGFPKDYCWILNYFLQRVFTAETTEIPILPSDFILLGVGTPMNQSQFSSALKDRGFDQDSILSSVRVNAQYGKANIYEVWLSRNVWAKFVEEFGSCILDGFDPLLTVGVFETAVAQKRLLERVKQTNHTVRQLYLHYLKVKWPQSYIEVLEELGQLGRRDKKGVFWLYGIGHDAIQVQLKALQQDFAATLVAALTDRGIQGQALRAVESGHFHLQDWRGRFIPKQAWSSIYDQEKVRLVLKREANYPTLQCEIQPTGTVLPQIWLGGDSHVENSERISQGLAPFLRRDLAGILDVVSRGFSGFNSRHFLNLLPHIFPDELTVQVKIMVLWLGSNDCRIPNESQEGVEIEEYVDNLTSIIKDLIKRHIDVILITPPPLAMKDPQEPQKKLYENGKFCETRRVDITAKFAKAMIEVGESFELSVCDSEHELQQAAALCNGGLPSLYEDGLHLNEFGYAPINTRMKRIINNKINRRLRETLGEIVNQ